MVGRAPVAPDGSAALLALCAALAVAGVVAVLLVHRLAGAAERREGAAA